jgi:hypothetical protein
MYKAIICSAEPSSAKLDGLVSETDGSKIFRSSNKSSKKMMADHDEWENTPDTLFREP